MDLNERLKAAAQPLKKADALLVTAGAGMGVDSGLPDFRGNEGFWKAYPPMARLGVSFVEMANPSWFERDPIPGVGVLRPSPQSLSTHGPARGVQTHPRHRQAEERGVLRIHVQRRRPVSDRRFRRGPDRGMPRLPSPSPVLAALLAGYLGGPGRGAGHRRDAVPGPRPAAALPEMRGTGKAQCPHVQ